MAIAEYEINKPKVLSYVEYLTEGETPGHYEIVDGVRTWMTGSSARHNRIAYRISNRFAEFEASHGSALLMPSPLDIITRRNPLKVRQPDVSLISRERWGDRNESDVSPLTAPPELVVEVLSPSETKRTIAAKMREYSAADVKECWLAWPLETTMEVWELSAGADPKQVAVCSSGDIVVSRVFPGLTVEVNAAFGSS